MQVNKVQNINNNSYNPNFGAVKSIDYLGGFAFDYTKSARAVFDAFESSRVLKNFCHENDVNVSFIITPVSNYYKAGTLKIEKIFNNDKNAKFLDRIKNLFKKKEEQIIYINVFESNNTKAKEKLIEKINSIKFDNIKDFWRDPYVEFNQISKSKPKWAR